MTNEQDGTTIGTMTGGTMETNNRCVNCGEADMVPAGRRDEPYLGLPGTTLVDLEVFRCPACGVEEFAIPRMEALHELLAWEVATRPGRLSGREIRFLRKVAGWSAGADFARAFATGSSTVSRWEAGDQHRMDVRAELLLRVLAIRGRVGQLDFGRIEGLLARPQLDPVASPDLRLRPVEGGWEVIGDEEPRAEAARRATR